MIKKLHSRITLFSLITQLSFENTTNTTDIIIRIKKKKTNVGINITIIWTMVHRNIEGSEK